MLLTSKEVGPLRGAAPAQLARRRTRLRVDAAGGVAHRVGDGLAKAKRRKRNACTDDRQDQRIFGGRSTGLVLQHVDESLHVIFLPLKHLVAIQGTSFPLRVDRRSGTHTPLAAACWNRVKPAASSSPPSAQQPQGLRLG